ncbi:PadR family transcriptional regulator [Pseudonocardia aurantiaca]
MVRVAAVLTPLATSILAMVCERPMHPYEMYRLMMDRFEDRVVKVRPGSLYHSVARLAADGLVEAIGTDREGGRPERTTYRVTDAGRVAMQEWIRGVLAKPVNEFPRFPVALGEAHNLPRAEAIELLTARIRHIEAELAEVEPALAHGATNTAEAYLLDGNYLVEMLRAELSWLRRLVARLETKELGWPLDD